MSILSGLIVWISVFLASFVLSESGFTDAIFSVLLPYFRSMFFLFILWFFASFSYYVELVCLCIALGFVRYGFEGYYLN